MVHNTPKLSNNKHVCTHSLWGAGLRPGLLAHLCLATDPVGSSVTTTRHAQVSTTGWMWADPGWPLSRIMGNLYSPQHILVLQQASPTMLSWQWQRSKSKCSICGIVQASACILSANVTAKVLTCLNLVGQSMRLLQGFKPKAWICAEVTPETISIIFYRQNCCFHCCFRDPSEFMGWGVIGIINATKWVIFFCWWYDYIPIKVQGLQ